MVNSNLKNEKKIDLRKRKYTRKCQYCGNRLPPNEMTTIPKNQQQLSVWIEILGPEFAENIKKSNYSGICLSHIENENRGPYRLPKNINNVILNSKPKVRKPQKCSTDHYQKCRYCGISRSKLDLTNIPRNPKQLSKWIKILGPEFSQNIKKFKANAICLDHIKNRDRGHFRLPMKIQNNPTLTTDVEKVDEEQIPEETLKRDDRRRAKNEIGKTNQEAAKKQQNQVPIIDILGFETMNKEHQNQSYTTIQKSGMVNLKCEVVGIRTERSVESNSESIENSYQKVTEESSQEMEKEDRDCIEMVPPKREMMDVEKNYQPKRIIVKVEVEEDQECVKMVPPKFRESQPNVVEDDDKIQCRVCNKHFEKNWMTDAPTDTEEMQKWFKILGSEFVGNIIRNSPPHFICMSHLRMMLDKVCQEQRPEVEV